MIQNKVDSIKCKGKLSDQIIGCVNILNYCKLRETKFFIIKSQNYDYYIHSFF